jgi:ELWxxDGT repeat protein
MFICFRISILSMKRPLALLLCLLVMTMSLAGCVGGNDDSLETPEHVVDNLLCIGEIGPGHGREMVDMPNVITPIVFNGELYYFADNSERMGADLWKYNGMNASIVAEIGGWDETGFVIFNNELYFGASDEIHGQELWKYDGTTVSMVADIEPGSNGSQPAASRITDLQVYNGELYFSAYDAPNGDELWMYDGTNAPSMVANINPGYNSSFPRTLTVFNNELYFGATDGIYGHELWKYNGTNLSMVVDMNPQRMDDRHNWFSNGSFPFIIAVFNNELYFTGTTDWDNRLSELWKTDGINTSMVDSKVAAYGTVFEGDLILWTDTGLESYDGTNYSSIFTSHWSNKVGAMGISVPIVSNGNLFFGTINENYVQELWMYDGTNTSLVATSYNPVISNEEGIENPTNPMHRLTQYNDDLYVVVDVNDTMELCKYSPL